MSDTAGAGWMTADQERRISAEIARETPRLRNFVRRRVADTADAEDILQEVLMELVESYRLPNPVEQAGAWLFRVARNRITDLFRKKKSVALPDASPTGAEGESLDLEELLPSDTAGPEAAYARAVLVEELDAALNELREVFVAHEIEGVSFKDLAARSGVPINTLLSRKRYAVLHLRGRLREIYDEFNEAGD
jgi:RNA polymerase sigma factor (sigma-70 family)